MYVDQHKHYELFQDILEHKGKYYDLESLRSWVIDNSTEKEWIKRLSIFTIDDWQRIDDVDLCKLYSLGRINELLLLSFQKTDYKDYGIAKITKSQYIEFFTALNMNAFTIDNYSPFHHEIHEIKESAKIDEIKIDEHLSPTLMIGNLLFSRGIVNLRTPIDTFEKDLCEKSKIYWSYIRSNRESEDLSHGWGHNSQWRTQFRLDIESDDTYVYNLRGSEDLSNKKWKQEVINLDLLRYRHMVNKGIENEDIWIYDSKYVEQRMSF